MVIFFFSLEKKIHKVKDIYELIFFLKRKKKKKTLGAGASLGERENGHNKNWDWKKMEWGSMVEGGRGNYEKKLFRMGIRCNLHINVEIHVRLPRDLVSFHATWSAFITSTNGRTFLFFRPIKYRRGSSMPATSNHHQPSPTAPPPAPFHLLLHPFPWRLLPKSPFRFPFRPSIPRYALHIDFALFFYCFTIFAALLDWIFCFQLNRDRLLCYHCYYPGYCRSSRSTLFRTHFVFALSVLESGSRSGVVFLFFSTF